MLKLNLDETKKEKKWSDIIREQPNQKKNARYTFPSLMKSETGRNILSFILVLVTIISFAGFILSNLSYQDIYNSPAKYGLRRELETNNEGDLNLNQLIAIIASSKQVDVRKITDIEVIRQSNPEAAEFYSQAKNDDILIIMLDIGGAFIIRPAENKIINFSKITIQQ